MVIVHSYVKLPEGNSRVDSEVSKIWERLSKNGTGKTHTESTSGTADISTIRFS